MRSELWVCGFAHTDHRRGRCRVHRDTDCQQLRLLVRGRRLHLARGHEALVVLPASLTVFQGREISAGRARIATTVRSARLRYIAWPGAAGIQ